MSFYTNFEFYAGEDRDMIIDLKISDKQIAGKYPVTPAINSGDIISVAVPTISGVDLVKTLALGQVVITDAGQARITVSYSAAETATMITGSAVITFTRAGKARIFVASGAIVLKTIGNC